MYLLSLQHTQWQHFVSGMSADLKAREIYVILHVILCIDMVHSIQNEPKICQEEKANLEIAGMYA